MSPVRRGVVDNVLETIGGTPLVRLDRFLSNSKIRLFCKMEAQNPAGSIKDRPALRVIQRALAEGRVSAGSTVVESSSGNMGIGLAQACAYFGLRFICVVDSKTTAQNIRVLRAYGAQIEEVTEPDPETGELLQARLTRVKRLVAEIPGAFWPNQYENPGNPQSHYSTTMRELDEQLEGQIDYLFLATSTCGTMQGCGKYIRDHGLSTRLVAVDALGSLIFSDIQAHRRIPGLGAGMTPPLCDVGLIHSYMLVDDLDTVAGCRQLVSREAILAGGSSGAVLAAVSRAQKEMPSGSTCVAILPDRGERYLDTIYDDDWVRASFGSAADPILKERAACQVPTPS